MTHPAPRNLPAPPPGCEGWPWHAPRHESAPLNGGAANAPRTSNSAAWPRITVITPSFNQAAFLEATLRSVLLQEYPNLEFVVLDGGSSDGSVDIIRKYEPWLTRWRSHADDGHAAAVAEGWQSATGEIVAYLNSDDLYVPGALAAAAAYLLDNPAASGVAGVAEQIDERGRRTGWHRARGGSFDELLDLDFIPQPAVFARKAAVESAGGIDRSLRYAFDLDMWLRLAHIAPIGVITTVLAATRLYPDTVTAARRPETGIELERIAGKLQREGLLTPRQCARLRGSIAYVRTSIHLDEMPHSVHRVLATACLGAMRHPPVLLRFLGAALRRATARGRA